MITVLAYLPQLVWEALATALAAFFIGSGILLLINARVGGAEWLGARTVRVVAVCEILVGVATGIAGFFVDAEPH